MQTNTTRIALVTGANRGLGLATARRLAAGGTTVLLGCRDLELGRRAAAAIDGDVEPLRLDVDDAASVQAAANRVHDDHGRLDLLVNNAGILPEATAADAAEPLDVELLRRTFETNVFGAARVIERFTPLLRRSPAGRIVNVSSQMGSIADMADPASPYAGVVVPGYQASKAALNALTVAVGKRLAGTRISVVSVCPGWVQTDLGGPDNRAAAPLTADEAAEVVVRVAHAPADQVGGRFLSAAGALPW